jgi:HK97 family phage prohead protease
MHNIERRAIADAEARAKSDDGKVAGTGVFFNSWSADLGGMRERFLPGAFDQSIREDDIRVQWQHSSQHVLGRVRAGTARVWADERGLHYEADPPDAQWARDAVESIRRGDVDQNSFAFFLERDDDQEWEERDGLFWRTIRRARLREVGPQTDPAYPDTTVAMRSIPQVVEPVVYPTDLVRMRLRHRSRRG